jgi:hypothetical protein
MARSPLRRCDVRPDWKIEMILFVGVLLLVVLGLVVVEAKKRSASRGTVALIVVLGAACTVVAMFGILIWGFSGFG